MSGEFSFRMEIDRRALDRLQRAIPTMADQVVPVVTAEIVRRIQERWSRGAPSSPGQPPAVVTGLLRNSIQMRPAGRDAMWILVGTEYAVPLEFGTRRMAARPFLWPAMRWMQDERIHSLFAQWIDRHV